MSSRLQRITLAGAVAGILVTSGVIAYPALLGRPSESAPPAILPALQAERDRQVINLAGYRWVDQPKQTVAIPIDRAMDLIVAEAQAKRVDATPAPASARR